MSKDQEKDSSLLNSAFGDLAEEFSDGAEGAGAALGRSAKFLAGAIEVVVTSPLLIPEGYKKIRDIIKPKLDERVAKIPDGKLVEPDLAIAGPALEAMRFTVDEDEIANMFADLLAASMHSDKKSIVHHSFVEVLKQLSPAEARILTILAKENPWPVVNLKSKTAGSRDFVTAISNVTNIGDQCAVSEMGLVQIYVDNLCRLGLSNIPADAFLVEDKAYEAIEQDPRVQVHVKRIEADGREAEFERKILKMTKFGQAFCEICLPSAD